MALMILIIYLHFPIFSTFYRNSRICIFMKTKVTNGLQARFRPFDKRGSLTVNYLHQSEWLHEVSLTFEFFTQGNRKSEITV